MCSREATHYYIDPHHGESNTFWLILIEENKTPINAIPIHQYYARITIDNKTGKRKEPTLVLMSPYFNKEAFSFPVSDDWQYLIYNKITAQYDITKMLLNSNTLYKDMTLMLVDNKGKRENLLPTMLRLHTVKLPDHN